MTKAYLQCGEVLMSYETLYFQPPQKNHAISVTPPLLITITRECFTIKILSWVISQLRLVGSHNTNLGAVAHRALELYVFQFGGTIFLVTLACLDISSKKRCLSTLFTYHLKAHTISNKLVIKVSAQKKGRKKLWQLQICVQISVVNGIFPP